MSEEDVIHCNQLLKRVLWFSVICVFAIEAAANYILYRSGAENYTTKLDYMLFRYLFLTSVINFGFLAVNRAIIRIFHIGIYKQKYILMAALIGILADVTYSHYQFFSVFAAFALPAIISALFEDEKFQIGVSICGILAITPGIVAKISDPKYSWDVLPEIVICYMSVVSFGVLGWYIARYLSRRSERLREAVHEAKIANRAKSEFLANMSHEIRTPMNAIVGMCELVLREPDLSEEVREYCFNIQNSGRSLLAIINDILDFSKIESGKLELVEEEFNLTSTINDVINIAVTRKGDKKLELIVHVDPDIPSGLFGDELRIRQVLVNLVTNAVKYTQEGCVAVRISQKRETDRIWLRASVKDTGIGIAKEDLQKIFSSFQQVDTKKNRSVEGTGLGLAIARQLVAQMQGTINVSSEYGKGSEFWFEIPLSVKNWKPLISVRNAQKIHAAGFINFPEIESREAAQEYRVLVSELKSNLHTDIQAFDSVQELKQEVEKGKLTHLFTTRSGYLENKEFFDREADRCKVVVVQDRADAIGLPEKIQCMFKPFYILAIAAVFNHEHILTGLHRRKHTILMFTAPDAHVLVVDDNTVNLEVAVGLMRPYQMQVETAGSAKEALQKLHAEKFDLVFMDHMMPEIDGVEATRMIREQETELPIVALTANAINGVRETFLKAGMNDFIAKPIEISELDRVLRTWLPKEKIKESIKEQETEKKEPQEKERTEEERECFDPAVGISYMGGSAEAYRKILALYIREAPDKLGQLKQLCKKKDWKRYTIEVHALKSSSLSAGMQGVSVLAKELELAGKTGDYTRIERKNDLLIEQCSRAMESGMQYLREHPEKETQTDSELLPVSEAEALARLTQVTEACANFDLDEIERQCEEAKNWICGKSSLQELFTEIENLAEDFEYAQAAERANEAKARISEEEKKSREEKI